MLGKGYGGDGADGGWREELSGAKIGDSAFDVFPGSVLGKDCADDDFEAGTAGPPVLRAVGGEEGMVVGEERGETRWLRDGNTAERGRYGGDHLRQRGGLGHLKGTIARAAGQVKKWGVTRRERSLRRQGGRSAAAGAYVVRREHKGGSTAFALQKSIGDCAGEREFQSD